MQRAVMKAGKLVLRDDNFDWNGTVSAKKSRVAANTVMIVAELPFSAKILIFLLAPGCIPNRVSSNACPVFSTAFSARSPCFSLWR